MAQDKEVTLSSGNLKSQLTSDDIESFPTDIDALAVNDVVYIDSAGKAQKAQANSATKEAIGVVIEKVDATNSKIITSGLLESFSSSMTPGARYYLSASTAGVLTATKPDGANFAQVVGVAASSTSLLVVPTVGQILTGYDFPLADGSADQVLTTDGSGALSFANQSGGGGGSTAADDITAGDANVSISTSSGKVTLGSSTGEWWFDEGGTNVLKILTDPDSNDVKFYAPVDNGQIYFVKDASTNNPVFILSLLTDGSGTGYLGINQTSAANLLDIKCSSNSDQGVQIKNSSSAVTSLLSGEGLYYGRLQMKDTQTGNTRLQITSRPSIHNYMMDNNLGIGTTAPGTLLQLEGSAPYLTLKNDTSENSDGGCESRIIFEDHANVSLARIQGSHDGASDDTKGDLILSTHNGSSLVEALRLDSSQKATFSSGFAVGSDAAGDILYHNGTSYVRLAKGTADQVLTMNDAATAPNWETASGGGGSSESTITTTLTYDNACFDLGTSTYTAKDTVVSALAVAADKTITGVSFDIPAAWTQDSQTASGEIYLKLGDVWYKPQYVSESYGYVSESAYWLKNHSTGIYGFVGSRQSSTSSGVAATVKVKGVTNDTLYSSGYLTAGSVRITIYYT